MKHYLKHVFILAVLIFLCATTVQAGSEKNGHSTENRPF
jgi:hypothetical protein